MDIQNNPTKLFHIITLTKEDKTIILTALNIVYTLILFVYSFINLYISFYKGSKNETNWHQQIPNQQYWLINSKIDW